MHARPTHPTGIPQQGRQGWSPGRRTWSVVIVAALGLNLFLLATVQATTYQCSAGDVSCLITAITEANASGQKPTIRLEAGTYTLVDAYENDPTAGWSGLPSITGNLTIQGAGADLTVIERNIDAEVFRLIPDFRFKIAKPDLY